MRRRQRVLEQQCINRAKAASSWEGLDAILTDDFIAANHLGSLPGLAQDQLHFPFRMAKQSAVLKLAPWLTGTRPTSRADRYEDHNNMVPAGAGVSHPSRACCVLQSRPTGTSAESLRSDLNQGGPNSSLTAPRLSPTFLKNWNHRSDESWKVFWQKQNWILTYRLPVVGSCCFCFQVWERIQTRPNTRPPCWRYTCPSGLPPASPSYSNVVCNPPVSTFGNFPFILTTGTSVSRFHCPLFSQTGKAAHSYLF